VLRRVEPSDIAIFFDQQDDPLAIERAAVPSRNRAAHEEHWAKILADESVIVRTIVDGRQVLGYVVSFVVAGKRNVGYWLGRRYWGDGHATRALTEYLAEVGERPLDARVAEHNTASLRVLAKCGFTAAGEERRDGDPVRAIILRLGGAEGRDSHVARGLPVESRCGDASATRP
jgi:RimJ/RimL family protein N-acetyltransferase